MDTILYTISSPEEYEKALAEAKNLWDSPEGSKSAEILETLTKEIDEYEKKHFPMK